jgi:O-methyltransferase
MMIKKTVKVVLERAGYGIVQTSKLEQLVDRRRYEGLVATYYALIRQHYLRDLPAPDDERVKLIAGLLGVSAPVALVLISELRRCTQLDGDVCEFGVAQGATSALLAHEILDTPKNLWLFDSFQGLPAPSPEDELKDDIFGLGSIDAYEGMMSCPSDWVARRLQDIGFPAARAHIVRGFVEESLLGDHLPPKVCFAFLDFDFYGPTRTVLEYMHKTMVTGGGIVVHDYDFFSTGVKKAVSGFLNEHTAQYALELHDDVATGICVIRRGERA